MSTNPSHEGRESDLNRTPTRSRRHERWASRTAPTASATATPTSAPAQQDVEENNRSRGSSRRSSSASKRRSSNTATNNSNNNNDDDNTDAPTPTNHQQRYNRFAARRQQEQQLEHDIRNEASASAVAESESSTGRGGRRKKRRGASSKKSDEQKKKDKEQQKKKKEEKEKEEKEEKENLDELLEEALDEQERILGEPQDDFSYNRIPEWSQKLADLTLVHQPAVNYDAEFVSQGVFDELNRDVLAAQQLHNEIINLPDQRLVRPDPEEIVRACPAPYVTTTIKDRKDIFIDAAVQLRKKHEAEEAKRKKEEEDANNNNGQQQQHPSDDPNNTQAQAMRMMNDTAADAQLLAEQLRIQQQQQILTPEQLAIEQQHQPAAQSERLLRNLTAVRDAFQAENRPIGIVGRYGEDGTETSSLPIASVLTRQAALHRAMMEDQFPCHSSSVDGPYPAITSSAGLALRNFRNVPKVHAEFIVDATQDAKGDDSVLMDAGSARALIQDAELLHGAAKASFSVSSKKQQAQNSSSLSSSNNNNNNNNNLTTNYEGKRIISVNLGSMRIRDHPLCTREHYFAHALLDAYAQYKMLTSNLLNGLKSRKHYEIIVEQLDRSLMRRQRLNAMSSGGANSDNKRSTSPASRFFAAASAASAASGNKNNNNNSSSTSYEEEQLKQQLAAAKTKLGMAMEMEQHTLTTMWNSWKALQDYWRTDAASNLGFVSATPPAGIDNDQQQQQDDQEANMIRTQTLNRLNAAQNMNAIKGSCRLAFSLTRRDDPEQAQYDPDDRNNQNILDFIPEVVVDDPISVAAALTNAAKRAKEDNKNSNTNNKENKDNGNNHLGDIISESKISADSVIVLKLYIKTSEVAGYTLVGTTSPRTLDSVFGASFNETFELHVTREPQTILIHACLVMTGKVIAQVAIPPSLTQAAHELPFQTGERFVSPVDSMPHEVNGVIIASTTWTTDSGLTVESIERLFLNGDADPLDPRNAPLVAALRRHYQLRAATQASAAEKLQERPMISLLSSAQRDEEAAGGGVLSGKKVKAESILKRSQPLNDRRLQLLELRWRILKNLIDPEIDPKIDPVDRRVCQEPIPATAEATELLERQLRSVIEIEETELQETKSVVLAGGADPKDTGKAWLMKLREKKTMSKPPQITDAQKMAKILKSLPTLPSPALLIQKVKNWFIPHSGFNPPRELREAAIEELADRDKIQEKWGASTISCSVMKASNLPIREDGNQINAFVELRFVDKAVCTRSQPGIAPSWFETLSVPFEPEEFDDETLNFIDDDIVLSVYDEIRVALPTNNTTNPNSMVTHFRVERRFLGAVKVPFYTLYSQKTASIEASFRVFQPRISMGYVLSPFEMPTINLFISLNPPLRKNIPSPPSADHLKQQLLESPSSQTLRRLNSVALAWSGQAESAIRLASALAPKAAEREILPFAPTSSGDLQLLCRFLRDNGINVPASITSIPEAIRFVSLFHFEVDMVVSAESDQWSTITEFLAMHVGDYEELAILLTMLLRGLDNDLPIFMVTGLGDVYPQAVYVLIYLNDCWKLIDPRTGDLYDTTSTLTGLSEVSLVISHNQIWANIQPSGTPYRMMWNLDDQTQWMPMFDAEHRQLMTTIDSLQPLTIDWEAPAPRKECADFEDVVRRQMKEFIRNLRQDRNVIYHERIAVRMRDVLICMEDERRASANIPHPIVNEALQKALSEFGMEYKVAGCPVNRSVRKSDDELLVEQLGPLKDAIRESAVHEIGDQSASFAVAVHVRPYPCGIFSVWVHVVGLVQKL